MTRLDFPQADTPIESRTSSLIAAATVPMMLVLLMIIWSAFA